MKHKEQICLGLLVALLLFAQLQPSAALFESVRREMARRRLAHILQHFPDLLAEVQMQLASMQNQQNVNPAGAQWQLQQPQQQQLQPQPQQQQQGQNGGLVATSGVQQNEEPHAATRRARPTGQHEQQPFELMKNGNLAQ